MKWWVIDARQHKLSHQSHFNSSYGIHASIASLSGVGPNSGSMELVVRSRDLANQVELVIQ